MSSLNNPHTSSLNNPTTARRRVPIAIAAICGLAAPLLAVVHTPAPAQVAAGYTVMHRLYNPNSGEHFYTASTYERDAVVRAGWKYEGEGWTAPTEGDEVYRLYNKYAGSPQDLGAAQDRWISQVISKYTKPNMTSMQKMEAISNGLLREFKYDAHPAGEHTRLLTYQGPYLATYRWNSFISPAVLTMIANRIGGFTTVENMYAKYPYGSTDWWLYHYTVRVVTAEGEERFFEACPTTDTGVVDPIPTIDLSKI